MPREIIGPGGSVFEVYEGESAGDIADPQAADPSNYKRADSGDRADSAAPITGAMEAATASPYIWIDAAQIPPRQWLHGRHFIRKFLSATISAGGTGKSSLELLDAISMVSGIDLLTGNKIQTRAVWYWNGEDPLEELQRRVQAIALHYGLTEGDLGGRLFLDSGRQQRIVVARDDRRHGITVNRPLVASMVETLAAHRIDVAILDPFISVHA